MNAFDKIIGYKQVKHELAQIADTLKNGEVYKALGVSSPRGLLLHGVPGVGKSLMARCLIEESERQAFVCRKTEPEGKFVDTIRKAFESAKTAAPSIVYLDDMDKFANGDERHRNSEEYVTVQSCIDGLQGKEVFVLATANEMRCLPDSLTRAGRFDRVIEIDVPEGNDAVEIVDHYLKGKRVASNLDAKVIADILENRSCATLEAVINEAGLIAGYKRKSDITMEEVVRACLDVVFRADGVATDAGAIDVTRPGNDSRVVWHEAGHAVVSEVVRPGSVVLASARWWSSRRGGFVRTTRSEDIDPVVFAQEHLAGALGGRAAVDLEFGIVDAGAQSDLRQAFNLARHLHCDLCYGGFSMYEDQSDEQRRYVEIATTSLVEEFYRKAKEALCKNREFLERMAAALGEKDVLLASDIAAIKQSCRIVEVVL
mgnify:CR=1 FL=1